MFLKSAKTASEQLLHDEEGVPTPWLDKNNVQNAALFASGQTPRLKFAACKYFAVFP